MRNIATLLLIVPLSLPTLAQKGPCTEELIKKESAKGAPPAKTSDFYLFAAMAGKPVVGEAEFHQSLDPAMATRKNIKNESKIDRIVIAPSGDMAYEYGTDRISYDDSDSGKHEEGTLGFLWVWRADGGSCKLAASMVQPVRE